jgi:hypothetical protein
MSKPSIQNISVTQTFQNWFDKTNEVVDIFRDQVITASVSGDSTTGNATLLGSFTANTVVAWNTLQASNITAVTAGNTIEYDSPIRITGALSPIVATFMFAAGGQTRYTDGLTSWDVGLEDSTNARFVINTGSGNKKLALGTTGLLEVGAVKTEFDAVIGTDLTVSGRIYGDITANNITVTNATGKLSGSLIGDVYAPNGTTKILENGNGTTIPATLTGNVNGTVSSLTNHTTSGLSEGTRLYFTETRARNALVAGTGVTYAAATGTISIGQGVGTGSTVTFAGVGVNGAIVATGNITAFGSVSDITMKENITPIENALDKVSQLGGYNFNYIGDDTPMTGVMAQELLKVIPGAVYETVDPRTQKTIYAVRHGNIIGLLIEAIKELKEKVGK